MSLLLGQAFEFALQRRKDQGAGTSFDDPRGKRGKQATTNDVSDACGNAKAYQRVVLNELHGIQFW